MQVGRKQEGSDAIMILTIDKPTAYETLCMAHTTNPIYLSCDNDRPVKITLFK